MAIHHTLIKKAQANDLALDYDGANVLCKWPERSHDITMGQPKAALEAMLKIKTTMVEYPELWIGQDGTEWVVIFKRQTSAEQELARSEGLGLDLLDEAIAEALENIPEDDEPEKGDEPQDDEEEREPHSIVPQKYRNEYKARGNPNNCSDWLCETIDPFVMIFIRTNKNGKPIYKGSPEKTYALAEANGIDKKWHHLNPGQQCMNARNMVRSKVVKDGVLTIPGRLTGGDTVTKEADQDWLDAKRKKAVAPAA